MAKMKGVWISQNSRNPDQDLLLTVGFTIVLNSSEVAKIGPDGVLNVRIRVMDEDVFSDDLLVEDNTFSVGVHDTTPRSFTTTVLVPWKKIAASETHVEREAEVYCKVRAARGVVATNWATSETEDVKFVIS